VTPASGIHVRPVEDGPGDDGAANAKTFTAFRGAEPAGTVRVITGAGFAHAGPAPNPDDASHEGTALMRLWVDPADPDPDRVVSSLLSTVGSHLARYGAVHALAMVDPRLQPSLERLGFHGDGPSAGGGRVLLHALCWEVAALRRAEPQGPDAGRLVFLADRESLVESAGPLGSVYEVVRGGLDLQELQDDGRTMIVGRLGRGDRFGAPEAAPHRTRTAVARGDCEIRVLSEPTVIDYARSGRGRDVPPEDTSARGPAGVGVRLFNEALAARVVWALHEIGVFRHVEPGALFEPAEVAATLHAVPELVIASLRFLARSGLAREEGGRYAIHPETLRSLRREMGLLEWLLGGYAPVLTALPRLLGGGARYGQGVLRDDAQMALASATISRELTDPDLFEELRFQGVRTVADVGCGSALRLIEVCRQLPYVTGVGVDISADCCDVARANVAKAGLGSRIDVVQSDAAEWLRTLRRDSSTPPDLLMCCAMFHDLASRPGKAEEFLAEARQTLQSGRTLLIQDQNRLPDDAAADDSWGAGFELIHHVMGQRLFLRSEYEALFARSGWKVTRRIETPIREGWIYLLEPAVG
jgi:ubiquinone/menaquinone biosynthesis C-methylase UbiE